MMLTDKHKQELRDKISLCRKLEREAVNDECMKSQANTTKSDLARASWKALDDWIYKEL